jgi:RNA polymerase sigma-70 factor, ECF subfamily
VAESVEGVVDHLFRHAAGQMIATLTRIFGPQHIALAEEVVQDALVKALQQWKLGGVPDKPGAWLFQVARNRALDQLRRETSLAAKQKDIEAALLMAGHSAAIDPAFAHELRDDQLRMMLMCCHPAIPEESRIALTLKTVSAFSIDEIARAFLARAETIAQRVVRAKRLIRDEAIAMEMPPRDQLAARVDSLLQVLYLMFNEGYVAQSGEELVRADVCAEAIRLAELVAGHPVAGSGAADALVALMMFQAARLPARVDAAGELSTLAEQDRSLWKRSMIRSALSHLERSRRGDIVTPYHLEAAIASHHATAPDFDSTDWESVIELYDELLAIKPSPVVALNRAVALAMVNGPQAGITAIEQIASHNSLRDYLPLATALGELSLRAGDRARAAEHFTRALSLPGTAPEKRFLLRRMAVLSEYR